MDEKKLVKKAMKGNASAYGQLIETYKEALYRTAFLHLKKMQLRIIIGKITGL